jgi:secondary thiamine-phosphate synthase enzyme
MQSATAVRTFGHLGLFPFHHVLCLQTHSCMELIDVTESIEQLIHRSGIRNGIVNIQSKHTTTAILINENEPLLWNDIRNTLERLAPQGTSYQHDNFAIRTVNLNPGETKNGHAHCKSMFLRTSETVNLFDGVLQLGKWQRIFFIELDRAKQREISIMILGQ